MLSNRHSYQRTIAIALIFAVLTALTATISFHGSRVGLAGGFTTTIVLLLWLSLEICACLVAAGGIVGLRRDVMELNGKPYYPLLPRECGAGAFVRWRRCLLSTFPNSRGRLRLRPGELVTVRSAEEIVATLDSEGRLDGLPFMPEMLRHCGRRYPVFRRIEKIHYYYGREAPHLRRLRDAVLLETLRCDGLAHAGCQAGCQFIWKEAWLVASGDSRDALVTDGSIEPKLKTYSQRTDSEQVMHHVCQMTELPNATTRISWRDFRHYWRDFTTGNVRLGPFLTAVALALFNTVQRKTGGAEAPYRAPNDRKTSSREILDLRPGELVRVKTKRQIEATLNHTSKNRGLWFDREMHRFCGGEFKVKALVKNIVDEATGKSISMKDPCVVLDGVFATGEYLGLCPQNELIFWREIWLERSTTFSGSSSEERR